MTFIQKQREYIIAFIGEFDYSHLNHQLYKLSIIDY